MPRNHRNAWIKAARKQAKRAAGLALPYRRKALAKASARVERAQAALGRAQTRLTKAKLAEAKASVRATKRDIVATEKAGKLTIAQARKAYKKMAAGLDRPLKGTDVKKHPKLFTRALPASIRKAFQKRAIVREKVRVERPKPGRKVREKPSERREVLSARERVIKTLDEFERAILDDRARQGLGLANFSEDEDSEYASTAEYRSKR